MYEEDKLHAVAMRCNGSGRPPSASDCDDDHLGDQLLREERQSGQRKLRGEYNPVSPDPSKSEASTTSSSPF